LLKVLKNHSTKATRLINKTKVTTPNQAPPQIDALASDRPSERV